MSPDIPTSTPSSPLCNLHAVLIASSRRNTAPSSSNCSLVGSSQTKPIQGETIEDKNESIVEIGASSTRESNIATSPCLVNLSSDSASLSSDFACKFAISLLMRPFNSAAAFFVKVIATVSVGSNPCQSSRVVLSLEGTLIAPIPFIGSLGADGKIRVALWSPDKRCCRYLLAITVVFPVPAPASMAMCLFMSKPRLCDTLNSTITIHLFAHLDMHHLLGNICTCLTVRDGYCQISRY